MINFLTPGVKLIETGVGALPGRGSRIARFGLQRTRQRLAEFEQRFHLTSAESERRLNASEIEESVEFSEWRMELGMERLLERQYKALEDAQFD
jgi:hypothetical protein